MKPDPELSYHIDRLTQDYIAQGLRPAEARRRARRPDGRTALRLVS
jgi:hypothetical protein